VARVNAQQSAIAGSFSFPGRLRNTDPRLLFAFTLFFRDPVPDVLRAVEQQDASFLPASQKTNSFQIDQYEFLQIERYRASTFVEQPLQILQMLRLHSAYQANGCSLIIGVFFDFPSHLKINSQSTCRAAIWRPFVNT
jgi:hypothetical protein